MTSGSYLDYYVYDKSNSHVMLHQKKKTGQMDVCLKAGLFERK